MGPLSDLRYTPGQTAEGLVPSTIKWLDNGQNHKTKLVTNNSEDDLVYKEEVAAIGTHRQSSNTKSIIKPFNLVMANVTGAPNWG